MNYLKIPIGDHDPASYAPILGQHLFEVLKIALNQVKNPQDLKPEQSAAFQAAFDLVFGLYEDAADP